MVKLATKSNTNENKKKAGVNKKAKKGKKISSKVIDDVAENAKTSPIPKLPDMVSDASTLEDIGNRYPILKDEVLVQRFLNVSLTNNQKGRIRQLLRDNLKGTSEELLPEVINNKIVSILHSTKDLTDSDLRKVRILYNMLKTTAEKSNVSSSTKQPKVKSETANVNKDKSESKSKTKENATKVDDTEKDKKDLVKRKGPKRYVVFVGNLPIDINREKLLNHFRDVSKNIKSVRIPKHDDDKANCIAYIELSDEMSYELALSKHHSMLDQRRINVQYTAQQKGKISKTMAKGKSAKLIALQKTGKLLGSNPMNRKRSFRRKKQKEAKAREEQAKN